MTHERPSVLIVLASSNRRGAEIQGSGLAEELGARGFRTETVALRPADGEPRLPVEAVSSKPLWSIGTLRSLRKRCASSDVVIAYGSVTLPACAIATVGLRTRFIYRSIGDPRAWARGRLHRLRTSLLYRRPDHVVALFDEGAEAIASLYRVDRKRISVIPNARSAERFRPPTAEERVTARRALGMPDDAPVVAVVGSFGPEKRIPLAIESIAHLPGAHLLVAGDGVERDAVRAITDRYGDRVHLLGVVDDVIQVYWSTDVMLSTSSTEGMPGVLIEAALCGVPAVATNVGGTVDVVGPGGRLVDVSPSALEIARELEIVLRNRAELSSAASAHAQLLTWASVGGLWDRLLNDPAATPPE